MNVGKKIKKIKLDGVDYVMAFDMKSIRTFKELTGKSYLQSASEIGRFDDELMLGFMGATIRTVEAPEEPIGEEVYNMNILYLLTEHCWDIIAFVAESMPQETIKPKSRPKKKPQRKRKKKRT